jgi:hypothetical protein
MCEAAQAAAQKEVDEGIKLGCAREQWRQWADHAAWPF